MQPFPKPDAVALVEVAPGIQFGGPALPLIAGPCVIENLDSCLRIAAAAAQVCARLHVPYIFKASFDKANRTSGSSFRGPGLEQGLRILQAVKDRLGLPVTSDLHEPFQVEAAAEVLDILQIPAFLARQTDLVEACGHAAARRGRVVNAKKAQFLSPGEMKNVVEKLQATGLAPGKILLTERGTFFGYHRLVNDFPGFMDMRSLGVPVVFDATHSCQKPGGLGTASGGVRELAPLLARAACAAGVDGLFLEIHDDPAQAKSDAATVMPLEWLEATLRQCLQAREAASA